MLLHGLSEDQRSFQWLSGFLAQDFRCIAYNLPTGKADQARLAGSTHAQLVEDLFALLDHLGIRQSYLFGSSFGSTIALAALRAQPERIPRAVLQGGFAHRTLAPVELTLALLARSWPGTMHWLPLRERLNRRFHIGAFTCPEAWEELERVSGEAPIAAVAHRAVMMHRLDLRPILPEIQQPVLLVCGDDDPLVGKECEADLLKGLPNAGRVELPKCGHFPYFTHAEALADVVRHHFTPPGATRCS